MLFIMRNKQPETNYSHNIKLLACCLFLLGIIFMPMNDSRAKGDDSATNFTLLYSGNTSGFTQPSG